VTISFVFWMDLMERGIRREENERKEGGNRKEIICDKIIKIFF